MLDWQSFDLKTVVPFRVAHGVSLSRKSFWIRLDGDKGWGEAAIPPYYGIADEDMIALWRQKKAAPKPLPEGIEDIPAWVGGDGPAPARCALDLALYDYLAKKQGVPLYELLGLERPAPQPTTITIPMAEPAEMARMAREKAAFPKLKLKLGGQGDVERVAAVRKARPEAGLIIDANSGWSPKQAVASLAAMEEFGLELIEQPAEKHDIAGMGYVQKHLSVPVVADESVQTMDDVEALAKAGVRGINLKLMKTGGIAPCLAMLKRARQLGLKIMLGCMIETSLGVTAMAHLSGLADWLDLDSPLLIANNPFDGVRYKDAHIYLPERPGIGVARS